MTIKTMLYYQDAGPKMHRHVQLSSSSPNIPGNYSLELGPVNQEPDLDMSAEDDLQSYVDEVSRKPLNAAKVMEARQEELSGKCCVWTEVETQEAWGRTGAGPIGARWIDINKGGEDNPNYRSRLVVKEVRNGAQEALVAATPPLDSIRFLLSLQRSNRNKLKVMFIDIKSALVCQSGEIDLMLTYD